MKLEKKHARQIAIFCGLFLEEGYQPLNSGEQQLLSSALGFARHHNIMDDAAINYFAQKYELPKVKAIARLDLEKEDMCDILDMIDEVFHDRHGLDKSTELAKTYGFLSKQIEPDENTTESL